MKKLLTVFIVSLFACPVYANSWSMWGSSGNKGSTYSVAVDSPTYRLSTTLWTAANEAGAESVTYQATSTADVYISTYAASTTAGGWKIVAGAAPVTIHNTSFGFALSTANVNVPLNILICK